MNPYILFLFGWLRAGLLSACPVCEKRQPKGFAGITHGTGPESPLDYWILYGAIAIVMLTFILFIWYVIKPKTRETCCPHHTF
ncbi:hypothetical protein [Fibrella aquatilis]|uniref:Uncharacterized protein n=1 Tax=Fibrella aquatilis TaxID=2817059 RepID=A0A939G4N9_9BACT|nr:hypothetical protein [Fibrella aquatilis]MBO0931831.1 hypothetical protein [Fibrella aquatilis]